MTFLATESDEAFRAELRDWFASALAEQGPPPEEHDWAARRAYDASWQRRLFDAGYAGMNWPHEFGGRAAPLGHQLVYYEEYARAGAPPPGTMFVGTRHAGPTLIAEGTDEQRAFHLSRILTGEDVWCQGFSEPEAGSDLASLRTRAVLEGDEYVVTGHKIWSTRAQVADWCELLVRTDSDAPKHQGISWLILDMRSPGIEVRPLRTIDNDDHFCEVYLDKVRVPVANLVGAENDGWRVTNVTLRFERGTAFASHTIEMRETLQKLVALAKTRRAGGGPGSATAWDDAGLRRDVGVMAAEVSALWRMTQLSIAEVERTGVPAQFGSAIKLRYSELVQDIADLFVRVAGRPSIGGAPVAGVDSAHLMHDYLWWLHTTIAAGTSQIQRNLIAERILALPKGP